MMKKIRSFIGVFVVILLCTTMCLSSFANEDKLVPFSGDVTGDEQITLLDALRLLRYICNNDIEIKAHNTDANNDGMINIADVLSVIKTVLNYNPDKVEEIDLDGFLISADLGDTTPISEKLYGIFLEDVSYSVDGGLYAEMVKNNSFEYEEEYANNGRLHAFTVEEGVTATVIDGSADESYLNVNNPHYLRLVNSMDVPFGIINAGYMEGMSVTENGEYIISIFAKGDDVGEIEFSIIDAEGNVYGKATLSGFGTTWSKKEASFVATAGGTNLSLAIRVSGSADIDCVSLMPTDTYKGSVIRKDLGEMLEGLSPKFFRFPGGCIIEGYHLEDAYDWKASVGNGTYTVINGETVCGDISARVAENNRKWGRLDTSGNYPYYMSYGVGFYEYFELCENLGCIPIPVINAGISCQCVLSETAEIGSAQFQKFVDDMLDLVEFANGGEDTYWGKIRTDMGHPEPFDLEYISIGNEQKPDDVYYTRYAEFVKALEAAKEENPELYGNIKLMQSLLSHNVEILETTDSDYSAYVDIHYYRQADWLIENAHRYDGLARGENIAPVYVGEYAGKDNTLYSAIAEAAHMTGFENNGDAVAMACYAPLLANLNKQHWSPNMIWFNNSAAYGSTSYYVQKLFANNTSTSVAKVDITDYTTKDDADDKPSGMVGVGTYATSAKFDNIKVVSNVSGEILYSDSFSKNTMKNYTVIDGTWEISDGGLLQSSTAVTNSYTANAVYFGDTEWSDYTLTFEATKLSGTEGFIIPICVKDNNNWFHWNIGGWGNSLSTLGKAVDGVKTGSISAAKSPFKVETGKTYSLKIVVKESSIECYIDGIKYVDYTIPEYVKVLPTGKAGVGTFATSAAFDDITVISNVDGHVLYRDNFTSDTIKNYEVVDGTWSVSNGALNQTSTDKTNYYTANVAYFGDESWTDYTVTFKATKLSGSEGFIIPFTVIDNSNWYHWNIGGYANTVSALGKAVNGTKTSIIAETKSAFKIETGKTYTIKIVVTEYSVMGYIDGVKYIDYIFPGYEGKQAPKYNAGMVGVGTYATTAKFDNIKVVSNETGSLLYSDNFATNSIEEYTVVDGEWAVSNGSLQQLTETVTNSYTANVVYFGDTAWRDYTFTFEATKLSGKEGFIIPLAVDDYNNWYHWNIGGWGNASTALEYAVNGVKTSLAPDTGRSFKVETGRTYQLKAVVSDNKIECYIDGVKYIDYTIPRNETIYQITGFDENGDIVVKIVNVSGEVVQTRIKLKNTGDIYETADVIVFGNENRDAKNTLANPTVVVPTSTTMKISRDFEYNAPAYSLTVIKIRTSK